MMDGRNNRWITWAVVSAGLLVVVGAVLIVQQEHEEENGDEVGNGENGNDGQADDQADGNGDGGDAGYEERAREEPWDEIPAALQMGRAPARGMIR